MQEGLLRVFFVTAGGLARQAALTGAAARGEDGGTAGAALALLTACLQWEFRRSGLPGQARMHVVRGEGQGGDERGRWAGMGEEGEGVQWEFRRQGLLGQASLHVEQGQGGAWWCRARVSAMEKEIPVGLPRSFECLYAPCFRFYHFSASSCLALCLPASPHQARPCQVTHTFSTPPCLQPHCKAAQRGAAPAAALVPGESW